MKAVILAGYRPDLNLAPTQFQSQLEVALRLTPEPIVVLAGASSESFLLSCRTLERCDLVYDTNGDEANLWTNFKAGLVAAQGPALVSAVESAWPEHSMLQRLAHETLRLSVSEPAHIVQLLKADRSILEDGFPLGVTHNGYRFLSRVKGVASLTAPEINYAWLEIAGADRGKSRATA